MSCCGSNRSASKPLPEAKGSNPSTLGLTPKAVEKVKEFAQNMEGAAGKHLRIAIRAGGCSGYSYDFVFDIKRDNDVVIFADDIKVLVDTNSMNLLKGSTVDFVESLQGAGFVVNNPNASGGCGCGSSFSA